MKDASLLDTFVGGSQGSVSGLRGAPFGCLASLPLPFVSTSIVKYLLKNLTTYKARSYIYIYIYLFIYLSLCPSGRKIICL